MRHHKELEDSTLKFEFGPRFQSGSINCWFNTSSSMHLNLMEGKLTSFKQNQGINITTSVYE